VGGGRLPGSSSAAAAAAAAAAPIARMKVMAAAETLSTITPSEYSENPVVSLAFVFFSPLSASLSSSLPPLDLLSGLLVCPFLAVFVYCSVRQPPRVREGDREEARP